MSIQVLRIENKEGIGIFRADNGATDRILQRHGRFPTPQNDKIDIWRDDKEWFCAYKSIDQIQQWILPREFISLIRKKFKIYLITVEEYQVGNYQVIFTKESITEKKDISELFIKK